MSKAEDNRYKITRETIPFNDEVMNRYVLDTVASAPESIYNLLTANDHYLIKNISATNLEQKLYLCGKLGKRFAFVVADRGKSSRDPEAIVTFINWCRKKFQQLSGTRLKDWGLFVRGDAELIQYLSRISKEITPKTMYLLRDYEQVAEGIDRVSDIRMRVAVEKQATDYLDLWVYKILKYNYELPGPHRLKYHITQRNLPMLFYMKIHSDRYVTAMELHIELGTHRQLIIKDLNEFTEIGLVQQDEMPTETGGDPTKIFQLTAYGFSIIQTIRESIISQKP